MISYYSENETFEIGKGKVLKQGKDISILFIGDMLEQAVKASEELDKKGVSVELIDMHTLKPFDNDLAIASIKKKPAKQ